MPVLILNFNLKGTAVSISGEMSTGTLHMQLDAHDPSRFSERERQVLQLLARGVTNKEIASVFTLSVRTVEHHRANVLAKLRARGRAELVEHAARRGWVVNG